LLREKLAKAADDLHVNSAFGFASPDSSSERSNPLPGSISCSITISHTSGKGILSARGLLREKLAKAADDLHVNSAFGFASPDSSSG
jgi:hypothetical protein